MNKQEGYKLSSDRILLSRNNKNNKNKSENIKVPKFKTEEETFQFLKNLIKG